MASALSPAKPKRDRSLVRIALDLALESRERMEAELIKAHARIEELEATVFNLQMYESTADYWQDIAQLRAEQLEAQARGDAIPEIGMTVDGIVGFVQPPSEDARNDNRDPGDEHYERQAQAAAA